MDKIRILVVNAPEHCNGVTWWRMFRPLWLMRRKYGDLDIRFNPGQLFEHDFLNTDIVLAFRPSNPEHPVVLRTAKEWGCKILLDLDDDILNLPLGHGTFSKLYNRTDVVNNCIALADEVWTSTEHLKTVCAAANRDFLSRMRREAPQVDGWAVPTFTVIPNAVLPSDLPDRANGNTGLAVWRGSDLHRDDLEVWRAQYAQILRSANRFVWIGYAPHWGKSDGGKPHVDYNVEGVEAKRWLAYLRSLRLAFVWKPLFPNDFNKSKSNIAWIEATCAGGICVTNFAGAPTWEHAAKELPKLDEYYIHLWQKSAEAVRQHYDLDAWNAVRYRQLLKLANNYVEANETNPDTAPSLAVAHTSNGNA